MRAVKIRYRFKGDSEYATCVLTIMQYENFKILPIMSECEILEKNLNISDEEIDAANQIFIDAILKEKSRYTE